MTIDIRDDVQRLLSIVRNAEETIRQLQEKCQHATSVYSMHGSTGHWDRDDSYWYQHYCYDCTKRWTTEQKTSLQSTLRVEEIDYAASAREIELQIELASAREARRVSSRTPGT